MYSNTGYLSDYDIDKSYDETEDFIVCSCGHYKLISIPKLHTIRPDGRDDWQMLYIINGCGYFQIEGQERKIEKGNIIIFPPHIPQIYYYKLEESPEIYWIHFSGNQVTSYLNQLEPKLGVYYAGIHIELIQLFEDIIKELQLKSPFYIQLCISYIMELFIKIKRESNLKIQSSTKQDSLLAPFLAWVHVNYKEEISIASFAHALHVSESYFIRRFKANTGKTPMQYFISIRMTHACELLLNTSMSVSETAVMVGYDNPLYFSRLFKKTVGVSPKNYRMGKNPKK